MHRIIYDFKAVVAYFMGTTAFFGCFLSLFGEKSLTLHDF